MKILKVLFVAVIAVGLASCGENAGKNCAQENWVGTYSGTVDCDGVTEAVTINVTASGSEAVVVKYEYGDPSFSIEGEYDPTTPDGCAIDITGMEAGFTVTVNVTLDEDNITISETISDGTDTSICNFTATRD